MAAPSIEKKTTGFYLLFLVCMNVACVVAQEIPSTASAPFATDYAITWGAEQVQMGADGSVALTMNPNSGSGYGSKEMYTYGYVSTQIKLPVGNSAGVVVAYFLSSEMSTGVHDELDFEMLGNKTGEPWILQTNVFADGKGEREQRIYLWFDPSADFHTYSVLWNKEIIIFSVDEKPIRIFRNNVALGVPFPQNRPVGVYSSLWNGEDWATRGGLDKIDWTSAPFAAYYKSFTINGCVNTNGGACANPTGWWTEAGYQTLTDKAQSDLLWVKQNYMIYDYCTDVERYPVAPVECATN